MLSSWPVGDKNVKEVNIVLLGYGNIGRAFLQVLQEKKEVILARYGLDFRLHSVFRQGGALYSRQPLAVKEILDKYSPRASFHEDPAWHQGLGLGTVLESLEPGVVVECISSDRRNGEPGLSLVSAALERGWHVVTADKGPLVAGFRELFGKAKDHQVSLKISGATAAALPTLDVALHSLAGTEIYRIEGILNGTTNYILTRIREGAGYPEALAEAQSKGIAEPDPSLDVSGEDTASKILIISMAILKTEFSVKDVKVQGIDKIPPDLLEQGRKQGQALKLLGKLSKKAGKFKLEVALKVIDSTHPLFGVDGTDKGITFYTDTMGAVTVIGGRSDPRGAGAALLKDIIIIYHRNI